MAIPILCTQFKHQSLPTVRQLINYSSEFSRQYFIPIVQESKNVTAIKYNWFSYKPICQLKKSVALQSLHCFIFTTIFQINLFTKYLHLNQFLQFTRIAISFFSRYQIDQRIFKINSTLDISQYKSFCFLIIQHWGPSLSRSVTSASKKRKLQSLSIEKLLQRVCWCDVVKWGLFLVRQRRQVCTKNFEGRVSSKSIAHLSVCFVSVHSCVVFCVSIAHRNFILGSSFCYN